MFKEIKPPEYPALLLEYHVHHHYHKHLPVQALRFPYLRQLLELGQQAVGGGWFYQLQAVGGGWFYQQQPGRAAADGYFCCHQQRLMEGPVINQERLIQFLTKVM